MPLGLEKILISHLNAMNFHMRKMVSRVCIIIGAAATINMCSNRDFLI